jgi:signal transduction histidine kinase
MPLRQKRHPIRSEGNISCMNSPVPVVRSTGREIVASELTDLNEEQFRANRFAIVSRLADDLAHEIKNPLNAIIINLEVLKVRVAKGDATAANDRAQVIEDEVRRLHQLIDRMLLLVRPERHEESNLPLDSALDELLPLIEAQAKLSRNEFVTDCSATVFVPVRRDMLKFALLNLLMAAHAHLGEGGGTLHLRCAPDTDHVRIGVETVFAPGRLPAGHGREMEQAMAIAAALLAPSGGRIEARPGGVCVTLPRASAV